MSKLFVHSLIFLLSLLIVQPSFAGVTSFDQSIRRNWATEDGLPQISITDIAQDQQGFIWLTTEGGLVRFDGVNFLAFDGDETPLLSSPLLRSVVIEPDNSVLFASSIKLMRLKRQIFSEILWQGKSVEGVNDLALTSENEIIIAADQLYMLRDDIITKSEQFVGEAKTLLVYGEQVFIGGVNQLARYQQGKVELLQVKWPPISLTISEIAVYQQQIYLGTNRGLYKLSTEGELIPQQFDPQITGAEILKLYVDQWQNFWISTYDFLYRINQDRVAEKIARRDEQSAEWVVSAFEDEDGFLWFGSKSNGLTRLRQDATSNYGVSVGLVDPFVWTVAVADDRLFVGHNQGLAEFRDNRFVQLENAEALPNHVVYTLFADSQKRWWIGTRGGLALASIDNDRINIIRDFPTLAHTQINGVVEDNSQQIWIASYDGLYRFANDQLESIGNEAGLTSRKIRFVYVDRHDQLWVGSEQGLYRRNGNQFELVGDEQMKRSHITYIGETVDKSALIIGTFQSGFAFLKENTVNWFDPARGVPSKSALFVHSIKGATLVANTDGIYILPESDLKSTGSLSPHIILLDKGGSARVDSYRCCNGAGNAKGAFWRGSIWLPTLAGLVAVDTEAVSLQSRLPKPVFDGLYSDKARFEEQVNNLPATARDWRIDFTAPIFYRAQSLNFRYQLLGYDTK